MKYDFVFFSAFKSGIETGELGSVEVYQLMCSILGVPQAPNNGTWENVADLLEGNSAHKLGYSAMIFVFLSFAYFCK